MKIFAVLSLAIVFGIGAKLYGCGNAFPTRGWGAIAFSPNGALLASAGIHGIALFKVVDDVLNNSTAYDCWQCGFGSVDFSPDGSLIVSSEIEQNSVYLFNVIGDVLTNPIVYPMLYRSYWPESVRFSPDQEYVATANNQANSVSIFKVLGNKLSSNFTSYGLPSQSTNPISLEFSPDGKYIATANESNDITIFPFIGGGLAQGTSYPSSGVLKIAFSSNGLYLAAIVPNINAVKLYSFAQGILAGGTAYTLPPNSSTPYSVAFSPDSSLLATANGGSNDITVFNVKTGLSGGTSYPVSGAGVRVDITFSSTGYNLATADYYYGITLFNTQDWCLAEKKEFKFRHHQSYCHNKSGYCGHRND